MGLSELKLLAMLSTGDFLLVEFESAIIEVYGGRR